MEQRLKIYYPDTQIQKNLYTYGNEWMLMESWENYTGFYHKYITVEVFTEKEWNPQTSKKLVRFKNRSNSFFKYADLTSFQKINGVKKEIITDRNTVFTRYRAPRAIVRQSTNDEIINGVMERYFIYKRNEPNRVFFEIDKKQSDTYNTSKAGINNKLYGLLKFSWKLDGPERDVYRDGLLIEPGVIDTNERIVLRHSKKFPKLAEIVKDFKQFSIYDV